MRAFFIQFFDLFTFSPGLRKSASATPAFWLRLNVSLFFAVSALYETKRPSPSHGPKCVHFVHIFINSCYRKTPRSDYQVWTLSRRIAISKGSHLKLCYKKRLVKPAGNFNRLWPIYAFHAENDAKAEISHANYSVLLETPPSCKTFLYRVISRVRGTRAPHFLAPRCRFSTCCACSASRGTEFPRVRKLNSGL